VELPTREKGDIYTPPGRYRELEGRIRRRVAGQDIPTLFVYSFDHRTRLGPYLYVDKLLIPVGPVAVGAALNSAGFKNTRVVLEQWSPNVRTHRAELDGKSPEMLFVSAMQIHSASAYRHVRNAWRLGEDRPLILAGGAKAVYEPWDFFGRSKDRQVGADVVVTGEEFVILELLDRLLEHKLAGETMRDAFDRCRLAGLLEDIPGLVYRPDDGLGMPDYLITTGIQRIVQHLDELPMPLEALSLLEPHHRRYTLSRRPIPLERVGRNARLLGVLTTRGCKFRCPYCPIPAYNQFTFRYKDPERLVEEIASVKQATGIGKYFGTDDNFFNHRGPVEELFTAMARGKVGRQRFRDAIWFGTEGTEADVYKNRDLLPLGREGGLGAIWFGIEDMTGELIKKGQSVDKTGIVFKEMLANGIAPMPMMMHHDGQPFWSRKGLYGLMNQVRYLSKAGALSMQITILTPVIGTKTYEPTYRDGIVMSRCGDTRVEDRHFDGNHCTASNDPFPWRKQLNMLAGYAYFYNPLQWLRAALTFDSLWAFRMVYQMYGNFGVIKSFRQIAPWLRQQVSGPILKHSDVPPPKFPMVDVDDAEAEVSRFRRGFDLPVLDEAPAS